MLGKVSLFKDNYSIDIKYYHIGAATSRSLDNQGGQIFDKTQSGKHIFHLIVVGITMILNIFRCKLMSF